MSPETPPGERSSLPLPLFAFLALFVLFSTFSIAGTQTSLGVGILLWAIYLLRGRAPRPQRTVVDLPIALFLAATLLAVLFSENRAASLANCKNLLLASVVYFVGFLAAGSAVRRRLALVFLVSGAGSAAYGIAVFFLGRGEGALLRTPGSFSTAMTFGGILLIVSSLAASLAVGRGIARRIRGLAATAAALSLTALFVSFTRSSWIGAFVSLVVILALARPRLLVPFALLLAAAYIASPAPYRERVESIWNPKFRTNVQRIELLRGGWEIFKDHPIVGVGPRDLADIYRRYKPPEAVHIHGHMHNDLLQIAVSMGILGLAAFAWLFVSFYRLIAGTLRLDLPPPERAWAVGSLGVVTGFLVNGLFEWNFGDAEVVTMLYLVVGSIIAIALSGERR